jgi:hypothetical protein
VSLPDRRRHRSKDIEFCDALLEHELVDPKTLSARLRAVPKLDERIESVVRERIEPARGRRGRGER